VHKGSQSYEEHLQKIRKLYISCEAATYLVYPADRRHCVCFSILRPRRTVMLWLLYESGLSQSFTKRSKPRFLRDMAKRFQVKAARDHQKPQRNKQHKQKQNIQHPVQSPKQKPNDQRYSYNPQPDEPVMKHTQFSPSPSQGDIREHWSSWRLDETSRSHYYRARWSPYALPFGYRTMRNSSMPDGQGGWWHYEFMGVKEVVEMEMAMAQTMPAFGQQRNMDSCMGWAAGGMTTGAVVPFGRF
jgi:hypothetical protein